MSGSTQTQIIEIEDVLRSFGTLGTAANDNVEPRPRFNNRPVVALCLALLVFAPGCAAAAVFLMRADGTVPPIVTPDSNPPFVTKSDRLPMEQWSVEAVANLGAADEVRITTANANADPAFLSPVLIRGSLEEAVSTALVDPTIIPEPMLAPARSRPKREARRFKPAKLVAEIVQPAPPEPTFFEKLFGSRTN